MILKIKLGYVDHGCNDIYKEQNIAEFSVPNVSCYYIITLITNTSRLCYNRV